MNLSYNVPVYDIETEYAARRYFNRQRAKAVVMTDHEMVRHFDNVLEGEFRGKTIAYTSAFAVSG